jgi:HAD superfamily hydrolase (TIGR01509 family)
LDKCGCLLFDWGDTLMRDDPNAFGPMFTWDHVEVMPHALQVLTSLRSEWLIALATNALDSDETDIRKALQRVDLDSLFDKVYCFRQIGHKKPSSEFFKFILNDLKLNSSQIVMIGDKFENDILGANQFGIRAIWFNAQSVESKTSNMYCTIHDLNELPHVLGAT